VTGIVKRLLLGAAALGFAGVGAAPAQAAGETTQSGCMFVALSTVPTEFNGLAVGVMADVSTTTDAARNPIFATVSCKIQVNGVDATPTFNYSGSGVQVGADVMQFFADDSDVVQICQRVAYGTGTTTSWSCRFVTQARVLPQPITDLVGGALMSTVNPVLCPVLASQSGSYLGGAVVITPTGDVFLPGSVYYGPFIDCPPYDTDSAHAPVNTTYMPHGEVYFALPPGV
jgi:hypothetical protein